MRQRVLPRTRARTLPDMQQQMKGTQILDKNLMTRALEEFKKNAKSKFLAGIKEHNPDGTKGMCMMTMKDRVSSAKEEVIDLWFYLCAIEDGIDATQECLDKEVL